jgi:hypothetical protein
MRKAQHRSSRHPLQPKGLVAELQDSATAGSPEAVILVEGLSDRLAIEAAAKRFGRDLPAERVVIVPMGGATNLGRFIAHFGPAGMDVRLTGLCDRGESSFFERTLARCDLPAVTGRDFFVCDRDLEDELIRAVGATGVEAVIEEEGELPSLRRLQQMPFHRDGMVEDQLHRFMGVRSGRKHRYAPLLVEALPADAMPQPLRDLLSSVP